MHALCRSLAAPLFSKRSLALPPSLCPHLHASCVLYRWVVYGRAAGEYYVISDSEMRANYDHASPRPARAAAGLSRRTVERLHQQGFEEYDPCRVVWAREVTEEDMAFFRASSAPSRADEQHVVFEAWWGSAQRVEAGDFLV